MGLRAVHGRAFLHLISKQSDIQPYSFVIEQNRIPGSANRKYNAPMKPSFLMRRGTPSAPISSLATRTFSWHRASATSGFLESREEATL